jgi:ribosome-binding protein aMBF1 (putative translation factor)
MDIIEIIKNAMREKGVKNVDLSRMTGINTTSICLFLSKKRIPRLDSAEKILEALKIKLIY